MSTSTRTSAGLLLLAVIAIFVVVFLRPRGDIEALVPIIQESRISLIEKLEDVRPLSGFPGDSPRWLFVHQNPYVNRAIGGVSVYAPPRGTMLWQGVPIWPEAKLTFRVSVDPMGVSEESLEQPFSYRFKIGAQEDGTETILFDQVLTSASPRGEQSDLLEIPLEDYAGRAIDLAFHTESTQALDLVDIPALLPCWREPVVVSKGHTKRVGEILMSSSSVSHDLIAMHHRGRARSEVGEVWLRTKSDGKREMGEAIHLESEFETGAALHIKNGGARPAVAFAADGVLEHVIEDDVREGAVLRYGLGQRAYGVPVEVGGGEVRLSIDDEEVLRSKLHPGALGWDEVQFSLEPYVGRPIVIRWDVVFDEAAPERIREPGSSEETEIRVREIAIARPRISVPEKRRRRLSAPDRPNVILIVAETLRADHLGCYNQDVTWTPHLDALAARGVRYDSAISASSWTWPSTASILTGLYPESHGVRDENQSFLLDALDSLPEIVQDQGVSTSAFVTNGLISPQRNFDQGFETFVLATYANAHQLGSLATTWLSQYRDLQHFMYLHYFEPHDPCEAPEPFREKHVPEALRGWDFLTVSNRVKGALSEDTSVALDDQRFLLGAYRGEIEFMDQQVGELMNWLIQENLHRKTYVVFTADHGEEFWDHGTYGHGSFLYEESIHVPLIVAGPGIEPGQVISSPVENRWLFRSILQWMNVEGSPDDRCPLLPCEPSSENSLIVASTAKGIVDRADVLSGDPERIARGLGTFVAFRERRWKLICQLIDGRDGRELVPRELYDLNADPEESRDLLDDRGEVVDSLIARGESWLADVSALAVQTPRGHASAATQAILDGLGYTRKNPAPGVEDDDASDKK